MRHRMIMIVALAGMLTTSCSDTAGGDDTPDPTGVPQGVVAQVHAHQDSCSDLQVLFDGADYRGDSDAMDYIDATMRNAGCYGEE